MTSLVDLSPEVELNLFLLTPFPEILKFCQTSHRLNRLICQSWSFWQQKAKLDFNLQPGEFEREGVPENPVQRYFQFFSYHGGCLPGSERYVSPLLCYLKTQDSFRDYFRSLLSRWSRDPSALWEVALREPELLLKLPLTRVQLTQISRLLHPEFLARLILKHELKNNHVGVCLLQGLLEGKTCSHPLPSSSVNLGFLTEPLLLLLAYRGEETALEHLGASTNPKTKPIIAEGYGWAGRETELRKLGHLYFPSALLSLLLSRNFELLAQLWSEVDEKERTKVRESLLTSALLLGQETLLSRLLSIIGPLPLSVVISANEAVSRERLGILEKLIEAGLDRRILIHLALRQGKGELAKRLGDPSLKNGQGVDLYYRNGPKVTLSHLNGIEEFR